MDKSSITYYEDGIQKIPLKERMKQVGPNMILTGIVIGPGALTTAAMLGSKYGYQLVWLFFLIAFMGITFVLTTNHISLMTGMPILHAIRKYYGKFAASFVGVALFISCMFFTIGNVSGTGAGMNLLFGIDWKLGAAIMIALILSIYFSKNVYSKVEKFATFCVLGMIVAFYITLVGSGGPNWSDFGKGLVTPSFPEGSQGAALGFISTNAAVTTGIYATYLGIEKKWKKEDLFNGVIKTDSIMHLVGVIAISMAIMLVGAIVLHPKGITIKSPSELGDMLVPVLGNAAKYVMGIALLGAAFSSLLGNTQRSVVLLNAGFDKPTSLEDKSIRIGSILVLLLGVIIAFSYGGSPTQLILIANISTSIATPVAGLFLCLMICRKDVNEGIRPPRFLQVAMIISYIIVLVITFSALSKQIPNFLKSLGL